MPHKPAWFRNGSVFISYAPTVGINKDGEDLYVVDPGTGKRTDAINNQVQEDIEALLGGHTTNTSRWADGKTVVDRYVGVPVYFDDRPLQDLDALLACDDMTSFTSATLGELIDSKQVKAGAGHGSPSADMRTGTVPYIKVSDLRAGQVNINPTNRVTEVVARRFWGGPTSGLAAYDLITPIRTSKNIGDFAVLMPGQEQLVLTKEMLVLHAADTADFDNFYLLWAMSLRAVRRQWERIVFMQTNREDVGGRYREIRLPIPSDKKIADAYSKPMRTYYEGMHHLRVGYLDYLERDGRHHIFMSTTEAVEEAAEEELILGVADEGY